MACKTAQCWHPCPEWPLSESLPQLARCRCGSTGYQPHTCPCRSKPGLVKNKSINQIRGQMWQLWSQLGLENFTILRIIFRIFLIFPNWKEKMTYFDHSHVALFGTSHCQNKLPGMGNRAPRSLLCRGTSESRRCWSLRWHSPSSSVSFSSREKWLASALITAF